MKKLIATLIVLAASSAAAHAANYELCNKTENLSNNHIRNEQTLIQDHGGFFVVYAVENGIASDNGIRSPWLKAKNDGTAYGNIVYGPGYLSEGFKGEHYYAISDKASGIDHAFSSCEPAPKAMYAKLDAADKARKEQMNAAPKKEAPLPTTPHFNYKCDNGNTAFLSDDKGSFLLYKGEKMQTFIFDRHNNDINADVYQDNGEYLQISHDADNITVNFGHGYDFECTKTAR